MKTLTAKPVIQISSFKFVPSASALVDSLFNPSGTADGIYSVRKRGVMFKRASGEPFAFLVANPGQSQFFVTCSRQEDGRIFYMRGGLTNESKCLLGVLNMSHSQRDKEAARIWDMFRAPVAAHE